METLRNLAEIAVTIAGFSALITLFQGKNSDWKYTDTTNLNRIYIMVEVSLLTCVVCYLPILLSGYFNLEEAFSLASYSFLIMWAIYGRFVMRRNKRMTGSKNPGNTGTKVMRGVAAIIAIFGLLNAVGFLGNGYAENYTVLAFLTLCFTFYFFLRIIYTSIHLPESE